MSGHLFVTQGDLTKLYCDAWLMPGDAGFHVGKGFRGDGTAPWSAELAQLWRREQQPPVGWGNEGTRAIPLINGIDSASAPRAILVNVGAWAGISADWYVEGVRQFLATAAGLPGPLFTGRAKPLFAIPLVGTGEGGAKETRGEIIRAVVRVLHDEAEGRDIDIVLVAHSDSDFAAIQHARRQLNAEDRRGGRFWRELDAVQRDLAARLAEQASAGRLVLFLGAGVSMGAGLPSWGGLLARLAAEAELDDHQQQALAKLHPADRARIIETRLAARQIDLGRAICASIAGTRHSLAHSLLATLPVNEVVTLNYDQLFEFAAEAAGRPAAILPYQPSSGAGRWLLKLHGCVAHPGDIVLTREDYLRYADRRAALSGIVQALLITRHMLFVGFSLTDDNFQRIVDDVRKALHGTDSGEKAVGRFGTALLLHGDPLLEELWQDSVRPVGMADARVGSASEAARRLDIFLDFLLAKSAQGAAPILDDAYDGVLNAEERGLRELLRELEASATGPMKQTPAWRSIERALQELGGTRSTEPE